ncbi:hypothetical protein D3C78_1804910 [compost metagenome]
MKEEDRDEGGGRHGDHHIVFQRPAADPKDRLNDNGEDRAFQPEEHALDRGDVTEDNVDVTERQNG